MPDAPTPVLVLVRDLIFATKITGTAQVLNIPARLLRDPVALAGQGGSRLIVDLNLAGAIPAAAEWKRATGGSVVGFVSHVDADTIQAARDAGFDRVLARSQFVTILPQLLGGSAGDEKSGGYLTPVGSGAGSVLHCSSGIKKEKP